MTLQFDPGQAQVDLDETVPLNLNAPVDYLQATDYSQAYRSEYLDSLGTPGSLIWRCLASMPCSHFDSPTSVAPTLLSLKRHIQSLCLLLQTLSPFTSGAAPSSAGSFLKDQSFDWLNDLTKPYENDDASHQISLTTLLNNLQAPARGQQRPRDVCPLHRAEVTDLDRNLALPYAIHSHLLRHANECLERLDHEYSATGGLLSLLPSERDSEAATQIMAESTLIGQLIAYAQGLVVRNRELEMSLDDMRDLVAGQCFIPKEILSEAAVEGRLASQIYAYPQDRFVLAGLTDERWNWLCEELERQDIREGTQWVDIVTRYTRVRGQTAVIVSVGDIGRRREEKAAVVKVVMPTFPERATLWEQRNMAHITDTSALVAENVMLTNQIEAQRQDLLVLEQERRHFRQWQRYWDGNGSKNFQAMGEMAAQTYAMSDREKVLDARMEELSRREAVLSRKELEVEAAEAEAKGAEAAEAETAAMVDLDESGAIEIDGDD